MRDHNIVIEPLLADHPSAVAAVRGYLAELVALGAVSAQAPADDPADLAKLSPPSGAFLVARLGPDGTIVGCGGVRTLEHGIGEVKRMWVDASVRGQGLGRRLLAALERESQRLGHHTVRLDTSDVLVTAIAMYERAGYRAIAPYNDNPDAKVFFEKTLDTGPS